MKITAISDLHGYFPETPGGDLLIIAGDMTGNDKVPEWKKFFDWLRVQDYRQKVYIGGNHDNFLKQCCSSQEEREILDVKPTNIEYLRDSGMEFEGLKIWGSPWTATFPGMNPDCKAFTFEMYDQDLFNEKWDMIPEDTDILITHSPAFDMLDRNYDGALCGSKGLSDRILQLKYLKLHVCGHIHESYGQFIDAGGVIFINGSHVNKDYQPVYAPITIEL